MDQQSPSQRSQEDLELVRLAVENKDQQNKIEQMTGRVDALELATDDDLLESVQRFVQLRRQRTDPRRSAVSKGVAA